MGEPMMVSVLFAALMALLPPCPYEDSGSCAWDADTRGNGYGNSFVVIGDPEYSGLPAVRIIRHVDDGSYSVRFYEARD